MFGFHILQTLLGIYLLPGVNIRSKHFISLYFLEDLLQGASEMTVSFILLVLTDYSIDVITNNINCFTEI